MIAPDQYPLYRDHIQTRVTQYQTAIDQAECDCLVIDSGGLKYRFFDDTSYPFRLNPYAARLAPLQGFPESIILIRLNERKPTLLVYQPADFWHAQERIDCLIIHQCFTVQIFSDLKQLRDQLPDGQSVAYVGDRPELLQQSQSNPELLLANIDYQQAVKTPYEIDCIFRANKQAVPGHRAVAEQAQHPTCEYALHMAYLQAIGSTDDELPYDNIIAANKNAAILHYTHRQKVTQPIHSLLIDAGATYQGYCSDISRTYGFQSELYKTLITQLDDLQQALCLSVAPGKAYLELHQQACQGICEILIHCELLHCDLEQAMDCQAAAIFFPHGLGHLLGVQVHDRGGWQANEAGAMNPPPDAYPHLRLTRTLATNQVFTIEPGIYFIDSLLEKARSSQLNKQIHWQAIATLRPMGGIRIEDNVRVTENGGENLTREAFKSA